jgi:hypothetical protein
MMIPSFAITQNSMSAYVAVAAIQARQDWEDVVLEVAEEALEFAKEQASWEDRTGDARSGLDVDVDTPRDDIVLTLFHTVEYGQWLETIQAGRFAVIMPTLELYGPEIKRRIEG